MTSARVFYGLLATITASGVATTFVPSLRDLVATAEIMAAVVAVAIAVAKCIVDEIRWHREVDRVINVPATDMATPVATEMAGHDLVAE